MTQASEKYYSLVIQIVISVLALIYVVYKVILFSNWSFFFTQLLGAKWSFILILLAQLALSFINLSIETKKWQILTSVLKKIPFRTAFLQIIRGVQLGMLTPARTGEPVGKVLLFNKGYRTQALFLSATGSIMQNTVIILAGAVSILILSYHGIIDAAFVESIQQTTLRYGFLFPLVILLVIIGFYLVLKHFWANAVFRRISLHIQIYKKMVWTVLINAFIFTVLRFLVFSFQLWLILDFFKVLDSWIFIWLVPLYFLIITFIPSIALADLGIRSSIALFLFGLASSNTGAIVTSVFIIWLFNLAIPSLMGFFLLKRKNN